VYTKSLIAMGGSLERIYSEINAYNCLITVYKPSVSHMCPTYAYDELRMM